MRKIALLALICLTACFTKKPPPKVAEPPPPPPVIKVDGVEVAQSDIDGIAQEKSVSAESPEVTDTAIDLYLLRAYAKKHDIAAADTSSYAEEVAQLEAKIFETAPPPAPGNEPMLVVDYAYLFLDKVPKPQRKKAKASAEAFHKIVAADPTKTFTSVVDQLKLDGSYWHVADGDSYVASLFPWVPADLAEGKVSKINARPDAMEFIRLKKRYPAQYPDKYSWLMGYLKSTMAVEREGGS